MDERVKRAKLGAAVDAHHLTYDSDMATREQRDGAAEAEAVRVRRLREDARRPISVNLAETIALSHELIKMAEAAKRR